MNAHPHATRLINDGILLMFAALIVAIVIVAALQAIGS
jgi:hypothetical protein